MSYKLKQKLDKLFLDFLLPCAIIFVMLVLCWHAGLSCAAGGQ